MRSVFEFGNFKPFQINCTFEAYAFLMLATNVPTTIFSLFNLIQRLQNSLYFSAAFLMPGLIFCTLEIIALTHFPSNIHASVSTFEETILIIYLDSFNRKVDLLKSCFLDFIRSKAVSNFANVCFACHSIKSRNLTLELFSNSKISSFNCKFFYSYFY